MPFTLSPGTLPVSIRFFRANSCAAWTFAALLLVQTPLAFADETKPETAAPTDVIKADGAEVEIVNETVAPAVEPTYGSPIATRMRVGARVEAKGGEVRDVFIMVAVPLECPEQEVHVVEEDFSPNLGSVEFRNLPDVKLAEPGARQMLISIPQLGARQTASAVVTYEILTKHVYAPEETATLVIPPKAPKQLKTYLSGSPYINVGDRNIKDAIKEALAQRVTKGAAGSEAAADAAPGEAASPGETSPGDGEDAYETVDADANADPEEKPKSRTAPEPSSDDKLPRRMKVSQIPRRSKPPLKSSPTGSASRLSTISSARK